MYAEAIMRAAGLDEGNAGIRIGGRKLNNLRYADDTTLMAENIDDLKELIKKVKSHSAQAGVYLNIKKTKVMTIESINDFKINDEEIEVVQSFNFLGSQISNDGGSSEEIK